MQVSESGFGENGYFQYLQFLKEKQLTVETVVSKLKVATITQGSEMKNMLQFELVGDATEDRLEFILDARGQVQRYLATQATPVPEQPKEETVVPHSVQTPTPETAQSKTQDVDLPAGWSDGQTN